MFAKIIFFVLPILSHCWSYQTQCTKIFSNQLLFDSQQQQQQQQHDIKKRNYNKISATSIFNVEEETTTSLELKCLNSNEYLYVGQTQYGVSVTQPAECLVQDGDCLVTVDYLANECNGMNSCSIQLDAQYLHSCKNYSSYLSIAYKCLQKETQVDICSNTVLENVTEFYLKTPDYPNEYANNLNNCTCNVEYMNRNSEEKMNLKFELLEFDVEDGESNVPVLCNKDRMTISELRTNTSRKILCGQHKEFKEFNLITTAENNDIAINFTTDDSISRRGVLIKIKSINESKCPYNSKYYGSNNKCIKIINKKYLNYKNAVNYCKLLNGQLFQINAFDDNLKLNSYYASKSIDVWLKKANVELGIAKRNSDEECLVKRDNALVYENCNKNLQFICEFNVNEEESRNNNNNNKLRVSCGQSRVSILKTTTTTTSTTTTTTTTSTTSRSIKNELKKQASLAVTTRTTKASIFINTNNKNNNSDFVLIIGAISGGILIVIILLNVFFIWNYYNRKLKGLTTNNKNNNKNKADNNDNTTSKFLSYPSSVQTSSNESTLNDFIYLQNKQAYFNIINELPASVPLHVYETIPSLHYNCQSISSQNSNSYLIDSTASSAYLNYSRNGTIIVLNGQNYYLANTPTPTAVQQQTNGLSPTQLSTCSSTSSTRPLTSV